MKWKLRIEQKGRYVKVTVFCDPGVGTFAHLGVLRMDEAEFAIFEVMIHKSLWVIEDQCGW